MLLQTASTALRILGFQAGPQDLPYAPRLTAPLLGLAVGSHLAIYLQLMTLGVALAMALAMVGGTALVVRTVLRARALDNRYTQTYHAMLATSTILTLLLLAPFSAMAPKIAQVAANPELLQQPDQLGVPRGAALLADILFFWGVAVTTHIFRHAAGVRLAWAGLIAVAGTFSVMFMMVFAGSVAQALLGPGAAPAAP